MLGTGGRPSFFLSLCAASVAVRADEGETALGFLFLARKENLPFVFGGVTGSARWDGTGSGSWDSALVLKSWRPRRRSDMSEVRERRRPAGESAGGMVCERRGAREKGECVVLDGGHPTGGGTGRAEGEGGRGLDSFMAGSGGASEPGHGECDWRGQAQSLHSRAYGCEGNPARAARRLPQLITVP